MNTEQTLDPQLLDGIHTHLQWLAEFRGAAFTATQVDSDTIRRDDCCRMGQWIHGAGQSRYGDEEAFVVLRHVHQRFHSEAGRIADLINQGQGDAAVGALGAGSTLMALSGQVESAVRKLAAASARQASGSTDQPA